MSSLILPILIIFRINRLSQYFRDILKVLAFEIRMWLFSCGLEEWVESERVVRIVVN
jgi:hypothetical protein